MFHNYEKAGGLAMFNPTPAKLNAGSTLSCQSVSGADDRLSAQRSTGTPQQTAQALRMLQGGIKQRIVGYHLEWYACDFGKSLAGVEHVIVALAEVPTHPDGADERT